MFIKHPPEYIKEINELIGIYPAKSGYHRKKWKIIRDYLFVKDNKCFWCEKVLVSNNSGDDVKLHNSVTLEHLVPKCNGGSRSRIENCVLSCPNCNETKSDKTHEKFISWINRSINRLRRMNKIKVYILWLDEERFPIKGYTRDCI